MLVLGAGRSSRSSALLSELGEGYSAKATKRETWKDACRLDETGLQVGGCLPYQFTIQDVLAIQSGESRFRAFRMQAGREQGGEKW
jgi:hypothetical protein